MNDERTNELQRRNDDERTNERTNDRPNFKEGTTNERTPKKERRTTNDKVRNDERRTNERTSKKKRRTTKDDGNSDRSIDRFGDRPTDCLWTKSMGEHRRLKMIHDS